MLDKFKDLNRIRKMQADIKKQLEKIYVQQEKGDISVLVRGDKKIEKLIIDGEDNKELRELINDTMKEVDKKVEKQMRGQLGDLGFPEL
jgi:DNA-binding protein YbaB